MRRVELASGLPHRPARGLTDKISPVADDTAARSALGGRAGAALRLAEEPQGRRAAAGDGRSAIRTACASPSRCCWSSPSPSAGASGRPASAKPSRRSRSRRSPSRRASTPGSTRRPIRVRRRCSSRAVRTRQLRRLRRRQRPRHPTLRPPPCGYRSGQARQRAGGQQAHRARRVARSGRGHAARPPVERRRWRPSAESRQAGFERRDPQLRGRARPRRHCRNQARRRDDHLSAAGHRGPPADHCARAARP